jgi:hypothetical protein
MIDANASLKKATRYLSRRKVPKIFTSKTNDFRESRENRCVWHSAMLVDLLIDIPFIEVSNFLDANLSYLLDQKTPQNEWKWIDHPSYKFPPDTDDTTCALIALHKAGCETVDYLAATKNLQKFKDKTGLFYTWMDQEFENDIDLVVNANIFRWLCLMNIKNETIKDYLMAGLSNLPDVSPMSYYASPVVTIYFLIKALMERNPISDQVRETCRKALFNLFKSHLMLITESPLYTAMTASSLIIFGERDGFLNFFIEYLISSQSSDGSWKPDAVVKMPDSTRYGRAIYATSIPLVTAFCVEALAAFSNYPHS